MSSPMCILHNEDDPNAAVREAGWQGERAGSEEELRRLASFPQMNPNPVIEVDRSLAVTYFNPAAAKVFPDIQVAGSEHPMLSGMREVLADLQRRGQHTAIRAVPVGAMTYEQHIWCCSGDSRIRIYVADVTERAKLENQFRQAQKMEAIGRLTGGIAHDFNNLLMVINGYSDMLLQALPADDVRRDSVAEIKQAGERAASLTRQLLAFSRRQVLELRILDLNAVVAGTNKMLRRLIGEDIDLVTAPAPALGCVKADPSQIEQAIMNLAVNARDAMPQGGTLTIETANVELHKSYAHEHYAVQPGHYVMLAVSDTGCGMDAETRKHIFEPFFTTKDQGKGTGLGLSMVYGIVKQSGGYIFVHSEPGRGTAFKIYLPRVEEAVAPPLPSTPLAGSTQGSETILLVEDNEAVRELLRSILQGNGYTVLVAGDGGAALQIGEQHQSPIHLLISDVVMPGMDGRELASRLVALHLGMKVLFISGYTDDAVLRHGIHEQDIPFLQKPIAVDALLRKVREVLDVPESASESDRAVHV